MCVHWSFRNYGKLRDRKIRGGEGKQEKIRTNVERKGDREKDESER